MRCLLLAAALVAEARARRDALERAVALAGELLEARAALERERREHAVTKTALSLMKHCACAPVGVREPKP